MRVSLKFSALLAVVLVGLSLLGGTGAGAQEAATSEEEEFDLGSLDGIQYGVSRYYGREYSPAASTDTAPATEAPAAITGMGGIILEFDTDDNARSAYDRLTEDDLLKSEFTGDDSEGWDVDLGDESTGYKSAEESDGATENAAFILFQKGNYIYMSFAEGTNMDVESAVKDFGNAMMDADGSGEGDFKDDGTSTGGLWDKFKADEELVAGLIPADDILYPES